MTDTSPPPTQPIPPPGKTRPQPPPKRRMITRQPKPHQCIVHMLDGEVLDIGISKRASGNELFVKICEHLDCVEREYFGLVYKDELDPHGTRYWLDVNKTISHQKKRGKWEFEFAVKFYPPDPTVLKEALTRYLVCCQIRMDIVTGRLPCTFATQAVLGSFFVQGDLGDFELDEFGDGIEYLIKIPFAPPQDQTPQLLEKIAELHRDRKGMTPEQAEMQYLEYAKKIALYGIHMHAAKDSDYVDIKIGVGASGISIYRENLRINRFVWPKVLKISYRRNKFLLRIRPGEFETFESWIAFRLPSNRLAKRLWKLAIEHHAFLRLREPPEAKRAFMPRFGSKYRYSGRTLYQTRTLTDDRPQPMFERTGSKQFLNNNFNPVLDHSMDNFKPAVFREPNLSITSADDSFDHQPLDSPAERAMENSRIIHDRINEESDEERQEPRIIRPAENGPRREEPRVIRPPEDRSSPRMARREEPRVIRPPEDRSSPRMARPSENSRREKRDSRGSSSERERGSPRPFRPSDIMNREGDRDSDDEPKPIRPSDVKNRKSAGPIPVAPVALPPSEIKIEHRFVRREEPKRRSRGDSDDDLDSRMPAPPTHEPAEKNHHRGVPTALAAVGLPTANLRRTNDSDRGSRSSLDDMDERKPAPKEKPPTAPKPKPPVAKKPVKMMDM